MTLVADLVSMHELGIYSGQMGVEFDHTQQPGCAFIHIGQAGWVPSHKPVRPSIAYHLASGAAKLELSGDSYSSRQGEGLRGVSPWLFAGCFAGADVQCCTRVSSGAVISIRCLMLACIAAEGAGGPA